MNDLTQLATDSIELFNKADWDGIRSLCGPAIVYEETGSGRRIEGIDGPLATPSGVLPPSGATVETWSSMWLTWSGNVIVHERNHLDLLSMLAQLGALPSPAGA